MALQTPGTDPLFAWDIPGWTNQGATAPKGPDTLEGLPGNTVTSLTSMQLGAGSAGLMGWNMDPVGTSNGSALTLFQGGLMYVPVEFTTTNAYVNCTTGASTHNYVILTDLFGNILATTADLTTTTTSGKVAWATATTIGPGFYYVGACADAAAIYVGAAIISMVALTSAVTYSSSAPYAFPRFVKATKALSGTAPTGQLTLTASVTLGCPFVGVN